MDAKRKARYEAKGVKVSSGTQERADSLGILIHSVNLSRTSKTAMPAEEQLNVPKNEGSIGQQRIEGEIDE